jgi:hypothetical protein
VLTGLLLEEGVDTPTALDPRVHANLLERVENLDDVTDGHHADIMPTSCRHHADIMPTSCRHHANPVPTPCRPVAR